MMWVVPFDAQKGTSRDPREMKKIQAKTREEG